MSSELFWNLKRLWGLFLLLTILQTLFSLCQALFGKSSSIRQSAAGGGGFVSLSMTAALTVSACLFFPHPQRSLTICGILAAFGLLLLALKRPGNKGQTHKPHHSTQGRWVKLTPMEITEASQKCQRGRIRAAFFFGFVIFGFWLLSSSSLFANIREKHPYQPLVGTRPSIPFGPSAKAVVFALIGVYFYFLLRRPGKSTMICPKCGAAKYDDGSLQCKCGGHFEDSKNLKWEE